MSDNTNTLVSNTTENVIYPAERANEEAQQVKDAISQTADADVNSFEEKMAYSTRDAKVYGSGATSQTGQALNQFEASMSAQTDQAVNEGKHNLDEAKATGTAYIQQVKRTATDVANAAHEYVSVGIDEHTPVDPNAPQDSGLVASLQTAASTAYETGKSYLAVAQETAGPHVRKVQETVQPHAESLIEAAKPYVNKAQSAISSALGADTNSNSDRNGTPKV